MDGAEPAVLLTKWHRWLSSSPSRALPYLSLAIGILAISFATFFVRWGNAPGPVSSTYRMGIAMLIQLPYLYITMHKVPNRPRRDSPGFSLLAGISMGMCLVLWSTAVLETRVANASLLANSAPVFVALYAWLIIRARLSRSYWLGLIIAIAGTVEVIGADLILEPSLNQGNLLALLSALFYAAYYLLVERSRQTMSTMATIWWIDLSATAVLVIYCMIARLPLFGYPINTWMMFFLNALIPQVIGYFAMTFALGRLPAWIVSPIMILQPVLTSLLAIPLMSERLTWTQILGGLAVVAGIYLINNAKNAE